MDCGRPPAAGLIAGFGRWKIGSGPPRVFEKTKCSRREPLEQNSNLIVEPPLGRKVELFNFGTHFVVVRLADICCIDARSLSDGFRETFHICGQHRQLTDLCQLLDTSIIENAGDFLRCDRVL